MNKKDGLRRPFVSHYVAPLPFLWPYYAFRQRRTAIRME